MKNYLSVMGLVLFASTVLASNSFGATTFAPTSFELLYQPTYTQATGGPTAQLGVAGAGVRIGYMMIPRIGFELGGYYNGYVFGDIGGVNQTAYAARATGNFVLLVLDSVRIYAGMDANAYFDPPAALTATGDKDLGGIAGVRFLVGGGPRLVVGAEYRYAPNTIFTYAGGSIRANAVIGTIGLHFGGSL